MQRSCKNLLLCAVSGWLSGGCDHAEGLADGGADSSTGTTDTSAGQDAESVVREDAPDAADLPFVPFQAIVKFRADADRDRVAHVARVETLLADISLARFEVDRSINTAAVDPVAATWAHIEELRARDDVEYAHPNWLFDLALTPTDLHYKLQWHYPAIKLPEAWNLTTGAPTVRIAILDTGRSGHPDLAGKWVPGVEYDAEAEDGDAITHPDDEWRHGVAVASIAGGSTNDGYTAGVCWKCRLLNVDVSQGDVPNLAAMIRGIRWSLVNGARVINMSLEHKNYACTSQNMAGLKEALDEALAQGVTVVAAAGNEAKDAKNTSPASCPGVIAVAATDQNGKLAAYSNHTSVTLAAPGGGGGTFAEMSGDGLDCASDPKSYFGSTKYGVVAAWSTRPSFGAKQHCARYLSGTSLAAPHVSGVVGLMLTRNPKLTPAQVQQILTDTVQKPNSCGKCGAGLINAYEAVKQAAPLPADAPPFADFTIKCTGLQCSFDAATSTDNSKIVAYDWVLPGEQFRTGKLVSAYMPGYSGTKVARLRVTDDRGQASERQLSITLNQPVVNPVFGQYHNPLRPSNRIDLFETVDAALVLTWYTFDTEGYPIWYTSGAGHRNGARWTQPLYQSTWNHANWEADTEEVGSVSLDFSNSTDVWFSWVLNQRPGGERYSHLFGGQGRSGAWFMPSEPGWGISVQESGQKLEVAVGFYELRPNKVREATWMRSDRVNVGGNLTIPLQSFMGPGLCPSCGGAQAVVVDAGYGPSTITLKIADGAANSGSASTNIVGKNEHGAWVPRWKRDLQTINILTKP